MTDDRGTPDVPDGGPFESVGSARDEALADSLGVDGVADHADVAADDLPTAASPEPRPTRAPRRPPVDLSKLEAAQGPRRNQTGPPTGEPGADDQGRAPIAEPGDAVAGTTEKAAKGAAVTSKGSRRRAPWWELPLLVAIAIAIAIVVKSFVIQPFYIPSASMEKTLHGCPGCHGDRILVNKPIYHLRDPHPGDIVVFHAPPGWNDEPGTTPPSNPVLKAVRGFGQLVGFVPPDGLVLVKRVIATGGQTVKGVAVDGGKSEKVMVSDHGAAGPWHTLTEPYVYMDQPDPTANFGPVTVPKGRLWVMGDHRNDSEDSRYHCGPDATDGQDDATCDAMTSTVPIGDVIGKAVVIAWPPSRWRTLGTPSTFTSAAASVAGGSVPLLGSAALVLPVHVVRRRRRRSLKRP
jgi:signal peptidase I